MKNLSIAFFIILALAALNSKGQELPNLKEVKLSKRADFKNAESTVVKVTEYLFHTPIDNKNKARSEAGKFLLDWMNGTPDHVFYLEEKETSYFNTNSDLLLMYMAALAKFSLAQPSVKGKRQQALGAMDLVLPYLYQHSDKNQWNKELWQLYDASKNAKLQEFLYQ